MMDNKDFGVWLNGVKLEPTVRNHQPAEGNCDGPFDEYQFTILGEPVVIHLFGQNRVTLLDKSFEELWNKKGFLQFQKEGEELQGLEMVKGETAAYLKATDSFLIDCAFYCTAEVHSSYLENCELVVSRLTNVSADDESFTKKVFFIDSLLHNCKFPGPGSIDDSAIFDMVLETPEDGSFEIIKTAASDVFITAPFIFLDRSQLDDTWASSPKAVIVKGIKLSDFSGCFPRIDIQDKFDYFPIALPSFDLLLLKDKEDEDNFWVIAENSFELGVGSNAPAGGFGEWLTHKLKHKGEVHVDSILGYVEECIQSRLKVLKEINARKYLRLSAVC